MAHALLLSFNLCLCLGLLACAWTHPVEDLGSINGRIVGGHATDIAVYPHQVSLRRRDITKPEKAFSHVCGGSIIHPLVVATAAHCVIATVPSQYKIVGATNLRKGNDGIIVNVAEIIMHEYYDPKSYNNDIALLILSSPFPVNNFTMRAIELATEEPTEGATATVTGWGATSSGGKSSDDLLAVQVPIVSNEVCSSDYADTNITDSMLCAGDRNVGGKDTCQGDSGGPLTVGNKLHGVVSWGYGCAQAKYPGVYAKVSYLHSWIKSKVELY